MCAAESVSSEYKINFFEGRKKSTKSAPHVQGFLTPRTFNLKKAELCYEWYDITCAVIQGLLKI